MRVLTFNSQATSAIHGRKGGKLRMEVRDGTLFIRPTDRKAGPHVLSELQGNKNGITVEITDKALDKLAGNALDDGSTFGLAADKYGWFAVRDTADLGDKAIEGAQITVAEQAA